MANKAQFFLQFSLLFLVLIFSTNWPTPSSANMITKYKIHIIDNLLDSSSKLFVHCKSKDSDKGVQVLSPHQEYVWGTRVNAWRTTLYFCYLKWEGVKALYIDAFKAKRDEARCRENKYCLWLVRENGIFFSNDNSTWFNEYPW